jgi:ABC-type dipeptide/oligopeptide/nickel transport system permease subunit
MRTSAETASHPGSVDPARPAGSRHPMGVISVILAGSALLIVTLTVAMVGTAAANMQKMYGRRLVEIPFAELPPSISVYVVVMGLAWAVWLASLVLAAIAVLRHRCFVCGTVALVVCAATPVLAVVLWSLTSAGL